MHTTAESYRYVSRTAHLEQAGPAGLWPPLYPLHVHADKLSMLTSAALLSMLVSSMKEQ